MAIDAGGAGVKTSALLKEISKIFGERATMSGERCQCERLHRPLAGDLHHQHVMIGDTPLDLIKITSVSVKGQREAVL